MPTSIPSGTLEKFITFGDLLRFLRRRAGITQLDLSIAVGYSNTQISRLEQNERLPDIPTIEARFVSALGLEDQPNAVARLLDLAENVRREDAPATGLSPYKGLNYFDESDADQFVGREALTARLTERVLSLALHGVTEQERFLAVVGASGSGKSSLVRAGLISALRWNKTSTDWSIHVLTPTAHPLESLAAALTHESHSVAAIATLMDDMGHDPRSLQIFAKRLLDSKNGSRLLLVVDQFEELFALCHSEQERAAFIGNLLTAASQADGPLMLVITLRADFYAPCANYPPLREALAKHQEYIGAMNQDELRRAIEEPAQRGRWELEPGLVDLLLHDVGREPGALPLLSHALFETWQRRRGRTMTFSGYTASGGVRGAIAETAEAVFADQFTHEQQAIARRIFLRLTELGDEAGAGDTRRRATFNELILNPEEATTTYAVLKALADARLITTSEDAAEVSHEALIREWPTLHGWLEDNREGLRLHRQLTEAAQEWQATERDSDTLYRGARLAQACEWANTHNDEMNALEHEFLGASVQTGEREAKEREEQRQRELEAAQKLAESESQRAEEQTRNAGHLRRRAVYLAGVVVLAMISTLAAGIFAYQANANFTRSDAQRLAAEANSLIQSKADPQLIALLSLHSMKIQHTLEGDTALTGAAALAIPKQVFTSQADSVLSVTFSPDGKYVLTGGQDKTARLWNSQTGQELHTFQTNAPTHAIFSPNGQYILTGGYDGSAQLWDLAAGHVVQNFNGHTDLIWGIAFSPDGKYIVTGSGDQTARLWDTQTGKILREFTGHTNQLREAIFSPDGKYILTTSVDNTARLWDVESGRELRVFNGHTDEVTSAAFSPDGKSIVTGSRDNSARLWDVETGKELQQFIGHGNWVNSVAVSADGQLLLTGSADKTIILWDIQTGRKLHQFSGQADSISAVAFSPDGAYLLSGSYDGTVWLWDWKHASGEHPLLMHNNSVYGVAFSPNGESLLTGGADDIARLWNISTGQEIQRFSGHGYWINSVAFSPNGKSILTGSLDGTARLWDLESGQTVFEFTGQDAGVSTVAFSPDGNNALTGSWDGTAKLWDTKTGRLLITYSINSSNDEPASIYGVAFSPDGKYVLTGSYDHSVRLWDAQSGKELHQFAGHTEAVNGVAFSPDGRFALSASYDKSAILWNVQTGQKVRSLTGHTAFLYGVAFSPSGQFALTASADDTARLWDLETGQELRRFTGHNGTVEWATFSPDGKSFATVSDDGTARLWDVDYHDTIRYLCSQLLRDFTEAERTQYNIIDAAPTCPKP